MVNRADFPRGNLTDDDGRLIEDVASDGFGPLGNRTDCGKPSRFPRGNLSDDDGRLIEDVEKLG